MVESAAGDSGDRIKRGRAAARKRLYSLEHKLQVIKETLEPGASVSIVARRHDINSNVVFRWRKLFREGLLGGARQLPAPDFAQVHVVQDAQAVRPSSAGGRGAMELVMGNGMTLRVDAAVDEAALRRVLAAVTNVS